MDEDGKTLLAILALLYGSSNGIGLFKAALDPLEVDREALDKAMNDPKASSNFIATRRWKLFRALWSWDLLAYVILVLLPPAFLAIVVWYGADAALKWVGLGTSKVPTSAPGGSLFYIILLALSLISSLHLLSPFLRSWGSFAKSLERSRDASNE